MKKILLFFIAFFFVSCTKWLPVPFGSDTFEVREGYLLLEKINENIRKQLPKTQKVGSNSIKILSVIVYPGNNKKSLIVDSDFIFKSFEIPEGVEVVARSYAKITYNPKNKEFHLNDVTVKKIKFLKEELLEYVSPMQEKFINDELKYELENLILHKSKKKLKKIKSFIVNKGKIKIVFE